MLMSIYLHTEMKQVQSQTTSNSSTRRENICTGYYGSEGRLAIATEWRQQVSNATTNASDGTIRWYKRGTQAHTRPIVHSVARSDLGQSLWWCWMRTNLLWWWWCCERRRLGVFWIGVSYHNRVPGTRDRKSTPQMCVWFLMCCSWWKWSCHKQDVFVGSCRGRTDGNLMHNRGGSHL